MPTDEPRLALTFDDVLIEPGLSEVHPTEVDLRTRLCRDIYLNIPVLSAAMDTVTESRLAIALAQEGGLGVVHKNLPIEVQAQEVDNVKRSEAGMIVDPITMRPEQRIREALALMAQYRISGVPVTDQAGHLVGILTNRDLRFESDPEKTIGELMTRDQLVTVPEGTTLDEAKALLHRHKIEKLLVVDRDGNLKGLITVKDIQKMIEYPHACKDGLGRLRVGGAVGASGDYLERAAALVAAKADLLVLDSSHAHSRGVLEATSRLRERFPEVALMVGNVATAAATRALAERGADVVKVGIGPGSICTTRVVTGAGMPQVTAIAESAAAGDEAGIPVVADGGIKFSGDITKAIAAGAAAVMIGSLFAGTEESPGETILYQGRTYKAYRGMGSLSAMARGSAERYFQEGNGALSKLVPEGIEGMVPHKGSVHQMLPQLTGGLRSGMGLAGTPDIEALRTRARFVRVTAAGLKESHAHDVIITKEAPNYWIER
ncbi:MAG: IMP dehydrogenase [Acidobacteria bacterium]|nr:IMP dehydrogenase [Thermoanaerobaculia bacterium]MDI9630984.1 IMP dehydrogenase [Acidobacteriota bacterium]OQC41182.1 MAG: Inosine-5'-monophosphate dehydrogenase [Acidobacteria bacterium ADurb.Bin051]MBP7812058.1 IMP dehydrogenase [Thermoanaerobaculia bacterium]MBP8844833.1 IMP dehydrogenase [Thermoanaerobaculia bacterium]